MLVVETLVSLVEHALLCEPTAVSTVFKLILQSVGTGQQQQGEEAFDSAMGNSRRLRLSDALSDGTGASRALLEAALDRAFQEHCLPADLQAGLPPRLTGGQSSLFHGIEPEPASAPLLPPSFAPGMVSSRQLERVNEHPLSEDSSEHRPPLRARAVASLQQEGASPSSVNTAGTAGSAAAPRRARRSSAAAGGAEAAETEGWADSARSRGGGAAVESGGGSSRLLGASWRSTGAVSSAAAAEAAEGGRGGAGGLGIGSRFSGRLRSLTRWRRASAASPLGSARGAAEAHQPSGTSQDAGQANDTAGPSYRASGENRPPSFGPVQASSSQPASSGKAGGGRGGVATLWLQLSPVQSTQDDRSANDFVDHNAGGGASPGFELAALDGLYDDERHTPALYNVAAGPGGGAELLMPPAAPGSLDEAVNRAKEAADAEAAAAATRGVAAGREAAAAPQGTGGGASGVAGGGGAVLPPLQNTIRSSIRSSVQRAGVKLFLHCGVCLLSIIALLLLDAALIAWIYLDRRKKLSLSLVIVAASNAGLVLLVLAISIVRSCMADRAAALEAAAAARRAASSGGGAGGAGGGIFEFVLHNFVTPALRTMGVARG
ncbi:hypothetical protein GPECTOR_5g101 [Gonium pectorale]|uniref:Uncharacterized protein n=1 Tax=Gonium pectorale TaxID=33097 RepID=A0A150GW18_GONPE|nr:hypothetical protein GPECTOR_5g101 [Gonium pectorale]|eukprot:KXZ53989.1 hypothetical protein GPECTOR_5g101 [Gonium pectorale]